MGYRLALHWTRAGTRWRVCEGGKVRLMTVYSQTDNLPRSLPLLSLAIIRFFSLSSPCGLDNYYNNQLLSRSATVNCPLMPGLQLFPRSVHIYPPQPGISRHVRSYCTCLEMVGHLTHFKAPVLTSCGLLIREPYKCWWGFVTTGCSQASNAGLKGSTAPSTL